MERALAIEGRIYVSPSRVARQVGVSRDTLYTWANRGSTWFGTPLNVAKFNGHVLIEESEIVVLAAVNKLYPVGKGPIPTARRQLMRQYAQRVRAKLMPAP